MEIARKVKQSILDNKHLLFNGIIVVIGIILVVMLSGFGYTGFSMSTKGKTILYGISFLYFFTLFIFQIKIAVLQEIKKKRKVPFPSILTVCVFIVICFILISFIFNEDKTANLNTYVAFALTVFLSYLILITFEAKRILKIFKNTIFILTTIAIVFYLITLCSRTFFSTIYFASQKNLYGTFLFITNETISGLTNIYHFSLRLTSVFWEPSVLATMILGALIAEIFTKRDKLLFVRLFVFIVGIVLSRSTTAYLMLPVVFLIFWVEKTRNIYVKGGVIIATSFAVTLVFIYKEPIINYLIEVLPDVFGKMSSDSKNGSFFTRIQSFGTCLQVFAKKPIVGFGGVTARDMYFSTAAGLIDAQTSTFGVLLASFGLAGVFYMAAIFGGIIFCKKIDTFTKFLLVPFVFLLSNAQGQGEILIVNVMYLLPLALVALPNRAEKRNEELFGKSYKTTRTVKDLFFKKSDGAEVSRNVFGALIIKGAAIIIAFLTIPVYLRYFNNDDSTYGIWIAITSILSVIMIFDFGMGNGLKNKLIKNIVNHDDELSKKYISTIYALTAVIGLSVFVVFSIVFFVLDSNLLMMVFFNGKNPEDINLLSFRIGVSIVLLSIGTHFFVKNINYVLQAHQKNAITSMFMVITNLCLMIFAFAFATVIPNDNKILALSLAYFVFLIAPLLIASIILYRGKFKNIAPSIDSIDFKASKTVVNMSFRFFAVQIGNLVLWSLNEILILFAFGYNSALITEYTEFYKLFSLMPIMLGTVIQQPIWTAISKAEVEHNKQGIKKYFIILVVSTAFTIVFNLILTATLPFVFDIWLGESAPVVTNEKLIAFIIYSVIYSISVMFMIIMNALALFKCQITCAVLGITLKIPAVIVATQVLHLNIGWELVIYVNMICYLPIFIFGALEIFMKIKKLEWWRTYEQKE